MMDDIQVLKRKSRAPTRAKVDRLKDEEKEDMLKETEEKNTGKKRRRILMCTVVLILAAILSSWVSSLFLPVERELVY